ncbi:MAG: hypothetical protein H7238_12495 [Polaromonas sp.]|nr:hypothetical protein [Polaromonas sp.]
MYFGSKFFPHERIDSKATVVTPVTHDAPPTTVVHISLPQETPNALNVARPSTFVARPTSGRFSNLIDGVEFEEKMKMALAQARGTVRREALPDEKAAMNRCTEYCQGNEARLREGLEHFAGYLGGLGREASGDDMNYVTRLARHVEAACRSPGTITHDMDIVTSEMLSFIVRKLERHPDDPKHLDLVTKILEGYCGTFSDYLENSHTYANVFPAGRSPVTAAQNALRALIDGLRAKAVLPVIDSLRYVGHTTLTSSKPAHDPFEPQGEWVNHHGHGLNNYHAGRLVEGGVSWEATQGLDNQVTHAMLMPIPHGNVMKEAGEHTGHCDDHEDYSYYADEDIHHTKFDSYDKTLVQEYNKLHKEHQNALTPCATGIEMLNTPSTLAATRDEAKAFAKNVTAAKLKAGVTHIAVVFGELTANKPHVPQEMLGVDWANFVTNVEAIQKAIFEAAHEGMLEAMAEMPEATAVKLQVRICFHNDTQAENDLELRTANTAKLSDQGIAEDLQIDPVGKHKNLRQPTIEHVLAYAGGVNKGMADYLSQKFPDHLEEARSRCSFEPVLQVGHLLGVNIDNWHPGPSARTTSIQRFFEGVSQYKTLRVQTDTSWLTASARYVNQGMGKFLQFQSHPGLQQIGERLVRADRISNIGFMAFASAERALQQRIVAGDNTAEVITTHAMMRACVEKVFQSYYQELGGIFDLLREDPAFAVALADVVQADAKKVTVSEGNFIGLVKAVYDHREKNTTQDRVPFVWGADGLTQFTERSGVEKFKLYRDQLAVESLMEMVGNTLQSHDSPQEQARGSEWLSLLAQIRTGPDRDKPFWAPANQKLNISDEGLRETDHNTVSNKPIRSATRAAPLGNRPPVAANQLSRQLGPTTTIQQQVTGQKPEESKR